MAAPSPILAGFLDPDFTVTSVAPIETERKLYVTLGPPAGTSPQCGRELHERQAEQLRRNHVFRLSGHISAEQPTNERISLPDVQPKRPEQWTTEDWNNRTVIGTDKYHVYSSGPSLGKWFVLKLSEPAKKLFYVDIEPGSLDLEASLSYLHTMMDCHSKKVYFGHWDAVYSWGLPRAVKIDGQ